MMFKNVMTNSEFDFGLRMSLYSAMFGRLSYMGWTLKVNTIKK